MAIYSIIFFHTFPVLWTPRMMQVCHSAQPNILKMKYKFVKNAKFCLDAILESLGPISLEKISLEFLFFRSARGD